MPQTVWRWASARRSNGQFRSRMTPSSLRRLVAPLGENLFQDGHPLGLTPAGQATFDLGGDVGAEALSRLVERRLGPSILKQLLLI